jgi:glycyl-tRNA synthetase
MEKETKENIMEKIVSLCKRRGFVFPASEIYGGIAGFWDYGPLGVELANNLKNLWWRKVVQDQENIYGIDGAIIQSPKLWEASGHVAGFTDPLVDCRNCGARLRADHLANTDSTDIAELTELLKDTVCPTCGKKELMPPRKYNMMMKTWVGPVEDESAVAYLRPETAGSIFVNFKNILDTTHSKLPFGIAQIGKAFRNEISPRDFIFRVRELEQMEMQYFIRPETQGEVYESWRSFAWDFLIHTLGISEENLKWHEHKENERAHYAAAAHDIYFKFPQGFKELWGTHNRTDFDLSAHSNHSGQSLTFFDEESKERLTPYIIESSVGVGRMLLAVLTDAYTEDELGGEARTYLKFHPRVAPIKAAIFPLLKNKPELVQKAREVYKMIKTEIPQIVFDDNGNIGKRYRRQDEIGTPFCVTIDFDTLGEKPELAETITIRDRNTGEQKRILISELLNYLKKAIA